MNLAEPMQADDPRESALAGSPLCLGSCPRNPLLVQDPVAASSCEPARAAREIQNPAHAGGVELCAELPVPTRIAGVPGNRVYLFPPESIRRIWDETVVPSGSRSQSAHALCITCICLPRHARQPRPPSLVDRHALFRKPGRLGPLAPSPPWALDASAPPSSPATTPSVLRSAP